MSAAAQAVSAFDLPPQVRLDASPSSTNSPTPVDGIWLWNTGALVDIRSDSHGNLTLTLIDSPDPLVETPIVIGTGRFAGKDNTYILTLTTHPHPRKTARTHKKNKHIAKTTTFTAHISDTNHLSLKPHNTGWRINPLRLIPYLLRVSITRPAPDDDTEAAIKIYPQAPSPQFPVIL